MARAARGVAVGLAACALVALTAGFIGLSRDEARVVAASKAYFAAQGPAICNYLSKHRLTYFGSYTGKSGTIAACKEAQGLTDPGSDLVNNHRRLQLAYVAIHGTKADAHFLRFRAKSYELVLVLEGARWKIDVDDDQIARNTALIGKRFSATEHALEDALLGVHFSSNAAGTGPAPTAVQRAVALTNTYIRLVRSERHLSQEILARKLRWYASDAAFYDCVRCTALLSQAIPAPGATV